MTLLNRPLNTQKLFVDTDMGVDDALAVAWLLRQPQAHVVGISTVFGNAQVENVTRNVLTLLDAMHVHVPISMGAAAPILASRMSIGAMIHGPDGFWFSQQPFNLDTLPRNAPQAILEAVHLYPDITIIALGPLTNIALAIEANPNLMRRKKLIALGGAQFGGNILPTAEFNIFSDPRALDIVLQSDLQLELIPLDAFDRLRIDGSELAQQLMNTTSPLGQLLGKVLRGYAQMQSMNGAASTSIPDAAATIIALYPELGERTPALVRVVLDGEFTRGMTIIATQMAHQIALGLGVQGFSTLTEQVFQPDFNLQATMGQIMQRNPANAQVILNIDAERMSELLIHGLVDAVNERAVG